MHRCLLVVAQPPPTDTESAFCMHDRVTKVFRSSGSAARSNALSYIGTVVGSELGEDVFGAVTILYKIVWDGERGPI